MRKFLLVVLILALPTIATLVLYFLKSRNVPTSRDAVGQAITFAGSGQPGTEDGARLQASLSDPFGIAVDKRGNVIVADGGSSNRIRRITPEGICETIAGSTEGYADGVSVSASFNTPSGVAIDEQGNIIIADTSNNRIRRLDARGQVTTIAGSGAAGHEDGSADQAQFDGPIGVAVDARGNIFVADAYNDRIRKISADGQVSTIAGADKPGSLDGQSSAALFDTPSGVAVDDEGNIFVADTGNNSIRRITPQGEVMTIAGGRRGREDGKGTEASFDHPVALAVTHDGFLFVADEGSSRIRRISPEMDVATFAGREAGFADGRGSAALFNAPSGVAVDGKGNVYVADTQNYLVRRISPVSPATVDASKNTEPRIFIQPLQEATEDAADAIIPQLSAATVSASQTFPWPLNPQNQRHEITGVVGEARGAPGGIALDHLHSGLDIRGNMGESVVSVLDEKISSPVAAWGFDESNEGIHLSLMSYIHIRVGRDASGAIQSPDKFKPRIDETGQVSGIRARRGARFKVGDFIGTLNRLYHVHLNFGPRNAQANPIEFPFIDFKDTIAPTIEPGGIEALDQAGEPMKRERDGRLILSGDVDIVVTAYDRADGNSSSRKLGLYKVGYQILKEDGSPAQGFESPVINIEFNRLPPGDESVLTVYAQGSGVSAYGAPTKLKNIVTNRVRDAKAQDGLLRASSLASGNYILKIIAEDYAGNRATGKSTDLRVRVEGR